MRRLVDVDELIEYFAEDLEGYDNREYILQMLDAKGRIERVEAIPIEFIKQLIEKFDCERGNAIKDTFAHILTGLLEFWEFEEEKENEQLAD